MKERREKREKREKRERRWRKKNYVRNDYKIKNEKKCEL